MRQLPACVPIERAYLGCLIRNPKVIGEMVTIVSPSDLYRGDHRHLYTLLIKMAREREPIDSVTVPMAVAASPALYGGLSYVLSVIDAPPSIEAVGSYARQIRRTSIARQLIATLTEVVERAYTDTDPDALVSTAAEDLARLGRTPGGTIGQLDEMIDEVLIEKAEAIERGEIPQIATGVKDLDTWLGGGLAAGTLTIIAARPGMGKTALGLNIATNIARRDVPAAVFSLEMEREMLVDRVLANVGNVAMQFIQRPDLLNEHDWNRMHEGRNRMRGVPFLLHAQAALTTAQIRSTALRWHLQRGRLGVILVDYLGLIPTDRGQRIEHIGEHCKALRALGKELRCPVVVLHQLNRGVESRTDKRPMLSDLRDSGEIEQDADNVILLYRDSYYNDLGDIRGAEAIIAKQRQGRPGTCLLRWDGPRQRFSSPDRRKRGAHRDRLDESAEGDRPRHKGGAEADRRQVVKLPLDGGAGGTPNSGGGNDHDRGSVSGSEGGTLASGGRH